MAGVQFLGPCIDADKRGFVVLFAALAVIWPEIRPPMGVFARGESAAGIRLDGAWLPNSPAEAPSLRFQSDYHRPR